jgi:hypothetical protein
METSSNKDGMVLLYEVLNRKMLELARQIDEAPINLTDKDDKVFDRVIKACIEVKGIAENIKWLRIELGLETEEQANKKGSRKNPMEARAERGKEG